MSENRVGDHWQDFVRYEYINAMDPRPDTPEVIEAREALWRAIAQEGEG